jgi:hypothetical protein
MSETGPTVPRCALPAIILLLSVGVNTARLWGQSGASEAGLGTDGFFTTTDGVKLYYRDAGRGRPIVFVPGGLAFEDIPYEPQLRELSKDYRTIVYLAPTSGKSAGLVQATPTRGATRCATQVHVQRFGGGIISH